MEVGVVTMALSPISVGVANRWRLRRRSFSLRRWRRRW